MITVDASKLTDKRSSHEYLKEQFGFPDYYGNNLDALYDCLTDMDAPEVGIDNISGAGDYFFRIYLILCETCIVRFI